ncbi:MAG: hypothetical protein LBU27_07455 [Candidatus Peribacteria bacterium]|jgi:UDP-N-acetylglucosamine:LPS N-acetylglucosamine transferase|nr:hypothetical protein [Candidatus Peribacteria bacterium]
MKKHPKKLIIAMAGGGTGGHVMPIRSLLETLFRTPDYASQVEKLFRFGSANSLEAETAEAFFPIPSHLPTSKQNATKIPQFYFQPILSGKLRRQKSLAAFRANLKDFILFTF